MRATTLEGGEEGPIVVRHVLRTEIVFRDVEGKRGKFVVSSDPLVVASVGPSHPSFFRSDD